MAKTVEVKVADLIKILEKERQKVSAVRADLRCLINVLKGVEPKSKTLFRISSDRADNRKDPCCGGCET